MLAAACGKASNQVPDVAEPPRSTPIPVLAHVARQDKEPSWPTSSCSTAPLERSVQAAGTTLGRLSADLMREPSLASCGVAIAADEKGPAVLTHAIAGFEYERLVVGDASYRVAIAGDGPAVVLLHGYPQTHYCWRRIAPQLARSHAVIAPDLRGYGATRGPRPGPLGEGYTKREMAADIVLLLDALGIEQAAIVGHDRGGRVAYRMALDHPDRIERLAVLNIVPTVEQFERLTPANAIEYWPWFFLAQPAPLPERLIAAAPEHYVRSLIQAWAAWPERIGADALEHYVEAYSVDAIAASCADYRASFHIDRPMDAADRAAGRRIRCPVLVLWGQSDEGFAGADEQGATEPAAGPLDVWRRWAEQVQGHPIASGHFIAEEAPAALIDALLPFLSGMSGDPTSPHT
jgi:haloacetate dehalogenase